MTGSILSLLRTIGDDTLSPDEIVSRIASANWMLYEHVRDDSDLYGMPVYLACPPNVHIYAEPDEDFARENWHWWRDGVATDSPGILPMDSNLCDDGWWIIGVQHADPSRPPEPPPQRERRS